jgi:hypothetical protein
MACLGATARLEDADGRADSAVALARRALTVAESAGDTLSGAYADALGTLVSVVQDVALGRSREGLTASRRLIAILDRLGRGNTLRMMDAKLEAARLLMECGELRAADSAMRDMLVASSGVNRHHGYAKAGILAGDIAWGMGRYDSAASALANAATEARRLGDEYQESWALEHLVTVLAQAGRIAEARTRMAERGALHVPLPSWLRDRLDAELAAAAGDTAAAYRLTLAELTAFGVTDPSWHRGYASLARDAVAIGLPAAADSLARLAIRLAGMSGQDPERSADVGVALVVLARARAAEGDSAGARDAANRAARALTAGLGADQPRTRDAAALAARLSR